MLKRVGLWSAPVVFILVMFYLPLTKIISLGTSGSWLDVYFQDQTLAAIWFTIWQSAVSTGICLVIAVPGAYILYRKKFAGQKFIRALITVPLVMPSLVVAITFSQFAFVPPIALIITAHVFVNFALMVRTIGGVWLNLDNETEEAAELAGAGRLRTLISITLPQLKPAIIAASALTFLFCSSSYGIILILGDGLVHSIETEVATSALQFLDLQKASALALLQTLLTVVAFGVAESISKNPIGLEQVDETAQKPQLDRRDWFAAVLTGLI
ncbi:MAG: ABC transporter permease subunit, partial [Actinobacteria bacterium]|nr:ABC transporter permease subunit [Actinomycetota bacterium]